MLFLTWTLNFYTGYCRFLCVEMAIYPVHFLQIRGCLKRLLPLLSSIFQTSDRELTLSPSMTDATKTFRQGHSVISFQVAQLTCSKEISPSTGVQPCQTKEHVIA